MKIISLNTWAGVLHQDLLEFFRKYQKDTDIFCLQEIYKGTTEQEDPHPTLTMQYDLFEQLEELLIATHVGYFHPAFKDFYGQAMFIKKEVVVQEIGDVMVFRNDDPKGRGSHSRNLQFAKIAAADKFFWIANVHGLWNGKGKTDTPARIEQSNNIVNFLKQRGGEIILIGDFNLSNNTQSLKIIADQYRNLIAEYGITNTRTSHYEKDVRYADYAFTSSDVHVIDFKVLPDEVSDHAALQLEINI